MTYPNITLCGWRRVGSALPRSRWRSTVCKNRCFVFFVLLLTRNEHSRGFFYVITLLALPCTVNTNKQDLLPECLYKSDLCCLDFRALTCPCIIMLFLRVERGVAAWCQKENVVYFKNSHISAAPRGESAKDSDLKLIFLMCKKQKQTVYCFVSRFW